MKRTLALTVAALLAASPAFAQEGQKTAAKAAATVLPVVGLAAIGTTSTFTATHLQTWTFPFHNSRFFLSPLGPNGGVTQGVHATGQYVSNVLNPKYFGETLYLDPHAIKTPAVGQHSTSAKYKTSHQTKSPAGKIAVGCIFGSALMTIVAANYKATRLGNPPRWRSQAEHERIVASGVEKKFELTNDEAQTSVALCGAGALYVMAQYR